MLNSKGVAYLAASFVTTHRLDEVAADYLEWIGDQVTEEDAQAALLAACRSSKSPAKVLANADVYYASFETDPPTITSITPNTGGTAGGTAVVIVGTNLTSTSSVTFGGTAGTSLSVVSDTEVHVTTPTKTAGAVNVVLTTPDGSVTKTNGFTYA